MIRLDRWEFIDMGTLSYDLRFNNLAILKRKKRVVEMISWNLVAYTKWWDNQFLLKIARGILEWIWLPMRNQSNCFPAGRPRNYCYFGTVPIWAACQQKIGEHWGSIHISWGHKISLCINWYYGNNGKIHIKAGKAEGATEVPWCVGSTVYLMFKVEGSRLECGFTEKPESKSYWKEKLMLTVI